MRARSAQPVTAEPEAHALPAGKRRLFTVVALLLPVLFFGAVEGGLRLAGYGDAYPLFVPVDGRPDYLYQSRSAARRYFARRTVIPTSQLDFFAAAKGDRTFRIFVQGGSTAAGFPFYYGGSFSRMLEQRLAQTFPDRPIEVVNTAMAAVNSYTLLDLSDEILAQRPDAVLVYAGHNEYYGALGVASSESMGRWRPLKLLYLRLLRLRTVQALRDGLSRAAALLAARPGEAPSSTMMERMVGEQTIPYGSPLYRLGLEQFRANLSGLLARYRAHGVPVFVGTLASNERDHRPFVSVHAPDTDVAAWEVQYRRGLAAAARGDAAEALDALEEALRLDSLSADAFYAKGQVLERAGRHAEARAAYHAAKDRDALRFRAPEAMNRIIREEAARHGAVVVETQAALAAASPHGLIGANVMTEHLHPNVNGYFVLADAFYEALQGAGLIGAWSRPVPRSEARAEVLLTPVDSLVGVFRLRRLMGSWPFQPPGVVDRSLDTLRAADPVEGIALDLYHDRVGWREANEALRRHYEAQGDLHRALQAALAHVQEYPFLGAPYLAAGNLLVRQYRFDEALAYFELSNEMEESAAARRMIGSILLQRGAREEAIRHLERAVALDPADVHALYNLGGAYALSRRYDEARAVVGRLLRIAPDHEDGRRLLAGLPPS